MKVKYSLILILSLVSLDVFSCGESAGLDTTICENNLPLNLGVTNETYWSGDGVDADGLFNPTDAGVYVLILHTNSDTCTDFDEKIITVLEAPYVNAGADQVICENSEFQINASASSSNGNIVVWSWSGDVQFLNSTNIHNPLATPNGSSSYNLTVADEAGCSSFDQINLNTSPLPIVSAGEDLEMCHVLDPQNLIGAPAGGTWNGPGVQGNSFISPSVGVHNLQYSYTDANGCENSDIKQINVSPLPELDPGPAAEVCENSNVFELADYIPANGMSWSGIGIVDGNLGTVDPSLLTPGMNEVTMTFGENTCEVTDVKEIFVNVIPAISIDQVYNFCSNEVNAQLTNATPAGGLWSGLPVIDPMSGFVNCGLNTGSYSVAYSYTDPGTSCSSFQHADLVIHQIPEADFDVAPLACVNAPLEITNNSDSGLSYFWTVNGAVSSTDEEPNINLISEGTHVLNLGVVSSFGCFDEGAAQVVEVISEPSAQFSLDVLEGCEPLEVNATNESLGDYLSYQWDFQILNSFDETPNLVNFGDISEDTDFEIQLMVENICGVSQFSETVSAFALPEAEFEANLITLCSPALVEFDNISSTNSESFNWALGDGANSLEEIPESKVYLANEVIQVYTITLEATNDCGTSIISNDITVHPNIVEAGFVTSEIEACAPVVIDFNDTSVNTSGVVYDFNGDMVNVFNTQKTFTESGVYEVFQYATDGCGFDTTSVVITIFPEPIVELDFGDGSLCVDNTQTLEYLGEELISSEWILNSASISTLLQVENLFDVPGEFDLEFIGTTALHGCHIHELASINVHPAPILDLGAEYFPGCEPFELTLSNSEPSFEYNMEWEVGSYSSSYSNPTFNFDEVGLYNINVSAENSFGCVSELELIDAVEVFPTPEAGFSFSPDELDVLYSPEVQFENQSEGGVLYHWIFGDGEESFEQNPIHVYEDGGIFPVELIVSNEYNCSNQISIGVEVEEQFSLFVPNSFTPNNDGINDVFKPEIGGLEYLEYSFFIYDRWGQIVFQSNDKDIGWIGNVSNGDHYVSSGVYSWRITFKLPFGNPSSVYEGIVSVIR